jgi:hypothetical protein
VPHDRLGALTETVMVRHSGLRPTTAGGEKESEGRADISVFPLTVPLIAGQLR